MFCQRALATASKAAVALHLLIANALHLVDEKAAHSLKDLVEFLRH
jgi:hypothetical protein